MNLAWNLTARERLNLYYDSCGGIGAAGGISVLFFSLLAGVSPESSV